MTTKIKIEIPGMKALEYELGEHITKALKNGGAVQFSFSAWEAKETIAVAEVLRNSGEILPSSEE